MAGDVVGRGAASWACGWWARRVICGCALWGRRSPQPSNTCGRLTNVPGQCKMAGLAICSKTSNATWGDYICVWRDVTACPALVVKFAVRCRLDSVARAVVLRSLKRRQAHGLSRFVVLRSLKGRQAHLYCVCWPAK